MSKKLKENSPEGLKSLQNITIFILNFQIILTSGNNIKRLYNNIWSLTIKTKLK